MRRRLDVELVRRGLAPSRARAVEAIDAGRVSVSGTPATTAARQVDAAEPIVVSPESGRRRSCRAAATSSRARSTRSRSTSPARRAVDVGASTGGFTDCLLQRGAAHVVAIDVGAGSSRGRCATTRG